MRILQFIETGGPGGAEQVVAKLSANLKESGETVFVGTLREGWLTNELDRQKINRVLFKSTGSFDITLILNIARYCKKNKIDLIHSHLLDSNFYCSLVSLITGIPCLCTEHGDIHHLNKKKYFRLKTKITGWFANKISAVSAYSKNALIQAGMKEQKIVIIRNPIEVKEKGKPATTLTRADLCPNILPNDWLWMHVGNLRPVKDQQTLIEGFKRAKASTSIPQKLIIIGDGHLRETLETLTRDLNLERDVIFLGHRNDVSDILPLGNGFILSSISEALPISILEAMRANLLVISTNVGGLPEIIQDGYTGFLFEPRNPENLAQKIKRVLEDQESARELCQNAQKIILADCEINKVREKFVEQYKMIIDARRL